MYSFDVPNKISSHSALLGGVMEENKSGITVTGRGNVVAVWRVALRVQASWRKRAGVRRRRDLFFTAALWGGPLRKLELGGPNEEVSESTFLFYSDDIKLNTFTYVCDYLMKTCLEIILCIDYVHYQEQLDQSSFLCFLKTYHNSNHSSCGNFMMLNDDFYNYIHIIVKIIYNI